MHLKYYYSLLDYRKVTVLAWIDSSHVFMFSIDYDSCCEDHDVSLHDDIECGASYSTGNEFYYFAPLTKVN